MERGGPNVKLLTEGPPLFGQRNIFLRLPGVVLEFLQNDNGIVSSEAEGVGQPHL